MIIRRLNKAYLQINLHVVLHYKIMKKKKKINAYSCSFKHHKYINVFWRQNKREGDDIKILFLKKPIILFSRQFLFIKTYECFYLNMFKQKSLKNRYRGVYLIMELRNWSCCILCYNSNIFNFSRAK